MHQFLAQLVVNQAVLVHHSDVLLLQVQREVQANRFPRLQLLLEKLPDVHGIGLLDQFGGLFQDLLAGADVHVVHNSRVDLERLHIDLRDPALRFEILALALRLRLGLVLVKGEPPFIHFWLVKDLISVEIVGLVAFDEDICFLDFGHDVHIVFGLEAPRAGQEERKLDLSEAVQKLRLYLPLLDQLILAQLHFQLKVLPETDKLAANLLLVRCQYFDKTRLSAFAPLFLTRFNRSCLLPQEL